MPRINWTNVSSFKDYADVPNTVTSGYFWLGMLWMVYIVLMITFIALGFGIEVALLSSTFLALVGAIFLVYIGLIAWQWALMFVGILLLLFLYIVWSSNRDSHY